MGFPSVIDQNIIAVEWRGICPKFDQISTTLMLKAILRSLAKQLKGTQTHNQLAYCRCGLIHQATTHFFCTPRGL